jgi:hypothetical protein
MPNWICSTLHRCSELQDSSDHLGLDFSAVPSTHEPDPHELSHLLASLVAFLDEHRYCGELDGGAEDEWIWMTCTCGAVISRTMEPVNRR